MTYFRHNQLCNGRKKIGELARIMKRKDKLVEYILLVGHQKNSHRTTVTLNSHCLEKNPNESVVEKVQKLILPQQWSHQSTAGNVAQVCKVSLTDTHGSVVTHSVTIHNDLSWSIFVHGHYLNCSDLPAQYSVPCACYTYWRASSG